MPRMQVRCPQCGKQTVWEGNHFRPFCSERCRLIDLGKWADGQYVIAGESASSSDVGGNKESDTDSQLIH